MEAGEARLNDLRGSVFRRGVKDGGWFELFAGERVAATCQRRRDGEGDPSLSDPGSPESIANVPAASLCCQSHSTGWGWRSAR